MPNSQCYTGILVNILGGIKYDGNHVAKEITILPTYNLFISRHLNLPSLKQLSCIYHNPSYIFIVAFCQSNKDLWKNHKFKKENQYLWSEVVSFLWSKYFQKACLSYSFKICRVWGFVQLSPVKANCSVVSLY